MSTNPDWELHAWIDWKPKMHEEECTSCSGRGVVGGGLGDLDGPRQCTACYGRGTITKPPTSKKPDIPKDLVEHMRRAWWDYWNKPV